MEKGKLEGFKTSNSSEAQEQNWNQKKPTKYAEQKAEMAFNVMDRDHDGYVTKKEMLQSTTKLSSSQVDMVFDRNDINGDGKLSKEEFKLLFSKKK